jgi:2-methylaconitate isomerase
MRGGTSKALMFQARDLPADRQAWDAIFMGVMGTPDPNGRQLNGMGGGVSSLSKICVLERSSREDADIDYTFAQVLIRDARVDYRGNCGNMISAVGPFAIEEGLCTAEGDEATVRVFNTNTNKIIHVTFPLQDGQPCYDGDLALPGVGGTGAPIRVGFIEPGGATTGKLLPSGRAIDRIEVPGWGSVEVSLVDAANATVFIRARDVGLTGTELPDHLDANPDILRMLAVIREQGSVLMGIAPNVEAAQSVTTVPYISFVATSADSKTLSGDTIAAGDIDLTVRFISNGQPHRALPLTGSLCTAVAARIEDSVVASILAPNTAGRPLRFGMPSGILTVDADVVRDGDAWSARSGSFYRTARRLFDGRVWMPGSTVSAT